MQKAVPEWDLIWIDNESTLVSLADRLERESVIAIDTETVGWQTGNERLCLVQIGLPSERTVALIDTAGGLDLSPLSKALTSQSIIKIAHNASFEDRQLSRYGIKIRGFADTLEMARRLRPDLPNHTLRTCCRLLLDLEISKEEQASDWSIRPLSQEQMTYAQLDAEVAFKLYSYFAGLEERLEVDLELSVPELMHDLHTVMKQRFALTKEIATELAYLNLRAELVRSRIRERLVQGDSAYEGAYGKCSLTKVKQSTINVGKVRDLLPEIAELVIAESVEKRRLTAVMKEQGIDLNKIESVSDVTGYSDRLNLTIAEFD